MEKGLGGQLEGLRLGAQVDLAFGIDLDEEDRRDLVRFFRRLGDDLPLLAGDDGLHRGAVEIGRILTGEPGVGERLFQNSVHDDGSSTSASGELASDEVLRRDRRR